MESTKHQQQRRRQLFVKQIVCMNSSLAPQRIRSMHISYTNLRIHFIHWFIFDASNNPFHFVCVCVCMCIIRMLLSLNVKPIENKKIFLICIFLKWIEWNDMACRIFSGNLLKKLAASRNFTGNYRCLSHYPIDETIFGLSNDQITVQSFSF